MQITRSSAATVKGPQEWFTGDVYIDAVAAAPPPSRVTASLVHFMPGARTHWHRHPLSQTVSDIRVRRGASHRRVGRLRRSPRVRPAGGGTGLTTPETADAQSVAAPVVPRP